MQKRFLTSDKMNERLGKTCNFSAVVANMEIACVNKRVKECAFICAGTSLKETNLGAGRVFMPFDQRAPCELNIIIIRALRIAIIYPHQGYGPRRKQNAPY